ncbi:MAG: ABC transporter permease [Nocardioidaceae bacterium]|nr:ABC transporter permease [Nocardioidaceae bacterium]
MTTTSAPGPGNRRLLEKAAFLGPGLLFTLVFVAVPLLLVLSYTVFERGRFGGVLYEFNLDNFTRALEPTYRKVLVSSTWIAGLATLLALLLGYPVAYAIAKMPARLRTVALVLVVVPFWTNFLIRTYAWIMLLNTQGMLNDALISLGLIDEPIRLLYTKGAVVTGLVYAYLPLMILPIYASVARLDPELREASANLGANRFTTFLRVTLPLSLPGVVTGCIFVFVPSMGNFVIPELLGGGKTVMVGNLIRDQFLKARDWPFGATLALIMVVFLVGLFAVQSLVSRRFATEVDR